MSEDIFEGSNHKWWDISTFSKDDNPFGMVTESSFATLFPKYREKYLRECWPLVKKTLEEHVRRIVEDSMKNIHPIYNIKTLMIKRELAKDERLKNEDWTRYLPKFKKRTQTSAQTNRMKKKRAKKWKQKNDYTPFPPPPVESKIDKELASGEYFLKEAQKRAKKLAEKKRKQSETAEKQAEKRKKPFIPPPETGIAVAAEGGKKRKKSKNEIKQKQKSTAKFQEEARVDLEKLKEKVRKSGKKFQKKIEM